MTKADPVRLQAKIEAMQKRKPAPAVRKPVRERQLLPMNELGNFDDNPEPPKAA